MAERLVVAAADLRPPPPPPAAPKTSTTLPLAALLPIHKWLELRPWRSAWALLLAFGALAPLIFMKTVSESASPVANLERVSAFFAIYFAVAWLLALRFIIRPERIGWQLVLAVTAPTALIGAPLAGLLEKQALANSEPNLVSFVLVVGVMEELAKWLAGCMGSTTGSAPHGDRSIDSGPLHRLHSER